MKKLIAAAGLGAALATGALAIAPAASATPVENTMFLQSLVNKGWQVWDVSGMIYRGETVCSDIDNISGWTGLDERRWLFNNTAYTWNESSEIVDSAVYNICPEFLPGGSANQV